jgi:biotin carboxyl carrier protein
MTGAGPSRDVDPRAVRVAVSSAVTDLEAIVLEPAGIPSGPGGLVLVDGAPVDVRLERRDPAHALLVEDDGHETTRTAVVMLPSDADADASGSVRREVLIDGWRIVVEIESEHRASLRDRAQRGRDPLARTGRSELRAVIPGRILGVSIASGDRVSAGQQVMVVEAMKMQNELRAPRDGVVARLAVGPGQTVEVGDLLLVLE